MDLGKKRGRTSAQDRYDKENVETISFKARKGSRRRIVEAAAKAGLSINGFIRISLNKAVQERIGVTMEDAPDVRDSNISENGQAKAFKS